MLPAETMPWPVQVDGSRSVHGYKTGMGGTRTMVGQHRRSTCVRRWSPRNMLSQCILLCGAQHISFSQDKKVPPFLPSFLPSFFPSFFLFLASTTSSHFTNSRRGPPVFWIQSLPLVSGWGVLPTAPLNGGIWFQTQPLLIFFPFAS